jgi:hypothetical protein
MATGRFSLARDDANGWRVGAGGLLVAGVLVGVAIIAGVPLSRALNPVGAILWLASGAFLARSLPTARRPAAGWVVAVASGVVLGAFIRPSGLLEAVLWFALAGAVVVVAAGDRSGGWALLAPAIYLPVHLAIGIGRAVMRGGGVRTDPPPTAAIVPLAMLLEAAAAGAAVAWGVRRWGWGDGA